MLIMSRRFSIFGANRPAILIVIHESFSQVDHWLNGYYQAILQLWATSALPIIGHLRIFMQVFAQAMPHELPYNSITVFSFSIILHGESDIPHPVTSYGFFYSLI